MTETPVEKQEIIIVRRNNGDGEGGHHGGAWKIAYADFVTAMMAFFLVMWLINSANEVTKARVASYFNPIKMTDATPSGRGVKDPAERKAIESPKEKTEQSKAEKEVEKKKAEAKAEEEKLLENPYAAIEEIVSRGSVGPADSEKNIASRSIGDPFDPKAWEALRNGKPSEMKELQPEGQTETDHSELADANKNEESPTELKVATKEVELRPAKDVPEAEKTTKSEAISEEENLIDEETIKLEKELKNIVGKYKAEMDVSVVVRRTNEGLLIMLGDNTGKGMFEIGSAKPGAGLVEIVGVIGKIMSTEDGDVVIRGHTDSRQYKSGRYDNWQLSSARAHMASYMLIRGGLPEKRIKRIEGHGSATPFDAKDLLADSNRRVEFLLTSEGKKP